MIVYVAALVPYSQQQSLKYTEAVLGEHDRTDRRAVPSDMHVGK